MKGFLAGLIIGILSFTPVVIAEEVPFATPLSSREPSDSAVGTLANMMVVAQIRHNKLWYAGKAKNWDLIKYEAGKIKTDLVTAASYYRKIPIENVVLADELLRDLMEAAKTENYTLFSKAFRDLTAVCNACHVAGGIAYSNSAAQITLV